MILNPSIEVQTSPVYRPSVPAWFAEVVILSQRLSTKGLLEAFSPQAQLVRGRFGTYEPLDFLAFLFGYAISGKRMLSANRYTRFQRMIGKISKSQEYFSQISVRGKPGYRRRSMNFST